MSGACAPRGRDAVLQPPVLSGVFRTVDHWGAVSRSGYLFRLWLPAKNGSFVAETACNLGAGAADAVTAETRWRCYAWPRTYDRSGLRTFYVDESGDVWCTEDARYSGPGAGPAPGAATPRPGTRVEETSGAPATYTGADANVWRKTN